MAVSYTHLDVYKRQIFTKAVESTSEYSTDLNSLWQEAYVDCITCSPDQFESKYAEYSQGKFWTLVVSIGVPALLIFGSVPLANWLSATAAGRAAAEGLAAFSRFLVSSPWNAIVVFLAVGAVLFFLTWLLLRRAAIRAAK